MNVRECFFHEFPKMVQSILVPDYTSGEAVRDIQGRWGAVQALASAGFSESETPGAQNTGA